MLAVRGLGTERGSIWSLRQEGPVTVLGGPDPVVPRELLKDELDPQTERRGGGAGVGQEPEAQTILPLAVPFRILLTFQGSKGL